MCFSRPLWIMLCIQAVILTEHALGYIYTYCDLCLLGTGRHEAKAVGASSNPPYRIGVPHSQLLRLLLLRVHSCPQGTQAPSWQQRLQAANKQAWKAYPLAPWYTSYSGAPHGIKAEARLQLRLHPCLDFFPCFVRPPTCLFSWEQPKSITFTTMPTRALSLWNWTQNTWAQHMQMMMMSLHKWRSPWPQYISIVPQPGGKGDAGVIRMQKGVVSEVPSSGCWPQNCWELIFPNSSFSLRSSLCPWPKNRPPGNCRSATFPAPLRRNGEKIILLHHFYWIYTFKIVSTNSPWNFASLKKTIHYISCELINFCSFSSMIPKVLESHLNLFLLPSPPTQILVSR